MAAAEKNKNAPEGAMLAVQAPLDELEALLEDSPRNIVIANRNSPRQGVLSGPASDMIDIEKTCKIKKINTVRLPVSTAFHSELVKDAVQPFLHALKEVPINPTAVKVFSNTTGEAYPSDPDKARTLLGNHLARPVEFVGEIENLFDSGVRTFVEIGPKSVLTGLISDILRDRDFAAVALDASQGKSHGIADLAGLLCRLAAIGYPVALPEWETPLSSVRKSRMNVLLSGANYRRPGTEDRGRKTTDSVHKPAGVKRQVENKEQLPEAINHQRSGHLKPSKRAHEPETIMNEYDNKQSELIRDALKVVSRGLQSMQHLQSETARAHQKFLEAQTEANRTLQEMMKNTQRLTERSLGINPEPIQPAFDPRYRLESSREMPQPEKDTTPEVSDNFTEHAVARLALNDREISPRPVHQKFPEGAANGYLQDTVDSDSQNELPTPSQSDRNVIEQTMLAVVSQLTGYPAEMLGLDMDIEAELGIDSIKRVEILSALEEKMPDSARGFP